MVAVSGTAGGVDEALHLGIACRDKHVQEAVDVGGVASDRVVQAAGHGTQCGLMEHVIDALAGGAAIVELADVAFDETEAPPLLG